jgi:hypothetical protein
MMPMFALQLAVLAPPVVVVLLLPPDAAGGLDELLLHAAASASRPHAAVALTIIVFTAEASFSGKATLPSPDSGLRPPDD